jgi:hypothetical protein
VVWQHSPNDTEAQHFRFEDAGGGFVRIRALPDGEPWRRGGCRCRADRGHPGAPGRSRIGRRASPGPPAVAAHRVVGGRPPLRRADRVVRGVPQQGAAARRRQQGVGRGSGPGCPRHPLAGGCPEPWVVRSPLLPAGGGSRDYRVARLPLLRVSTTPRTTMPRPSSRCSQSSALLTGTKFAPLWWSTTTP